MNGVIALTAGVETLDVGELVEVNPQAAHGVVHAGKDLHGGVARIVADELLVDLEDAFEFAVERGAVDVGQVKIDHRLAINAEVMLVNHFVDGAGGDVARHRLPYLGYHSSRKYQRSLSGILLGARLSFGWRGTQTRPPSPRADSDMSRSLSSPGIHVGCTWMNSPFA